MHSLALSSSKATSKGEERMWRLPIPLSISLAMEWRRRRDYRMNERSGKWKCGFRMRTWRYRQRRHSRYWRGVRIPQARSPRLWRWEDPESRISSEEKIYRQGKMEKECLGKFPRGGLWDSAENVDRTLAWDISQRHVEWSYWKLLRMQSRLKHIHLGFPQAYSAAWWQLQRRQMGTWIQGLRVWVQGSHSGAG